MKMKYYVGIDAGVKTGIGVWNPNFKCIEAIKTMPIHKAFDFIKDLSNKAELYVRVEDARQRKWFGKQSNSKQQGAGSIKRDCSIWEAFLQDLKKDGVIKDFKMVHPIKGSTKLEPELFRRATGYALTTSEHARDAIMLVYQLNNWN